MQGRMGDVSDVTQENRNDCIIAALEHTPGAGAFALDQQGRVEYATRAAAEILFRCDQRQSIGRSLTALLRHDYGEKLWERVRHRAVHAERIIWGGWQLVLVCVADDHNASARRGCTVQRVNGLVADQWRGLKIHTAEVADLGPLDVLSVRELEVASLIGTGMSVRDIAAHLHRSIKTIENHRISMGRKLGIGNRLEIALMANNAGLRPSDSELERIPPLSASDRPES